MSCVCVFEMRDANENEDEMWLKRPEINNSAGNLALHLTGNLRHFIGYALGKTNYERNRDAEFSNIVSRSELLEEIELAKNEISTTLLSLDAQQWQSNYPIEVMGKPMSTQFFMLHLLGHLNYHLGQINYFRRIK